jgi:hypothetical protein
MLMEVRSSLRQLLMNNWGRYLGHLEDLDRDLAAA